jgi:hypothetical protein
MPVNGNNIRAAYGHTHKQTTASNLWTVVHNLGREVLNDANIYVDGVLTKILPLNVTHPDNNTLEVHFTLPQTGTVRVS